MDKRNTVLLSVSITVAIVLAGFAYESWTRIKYENRLSHVPSALNVTKILYVAEDSWGFGPGGNETGVIVYELSDSSAELILKGGTAYLNRIPQNSGNDWRGQYDKWQPTPELLVGSGSNTNKTMDYIIKHYLDRYGFGIPIDQTIEQEINEAISRPGSFLAYGRVGFLLVIPMSHRVVYAYRD